MIAFNMYLGYGSSESESSKWEKVINEVVDSNAFDPPCLQSSNVQSDRKICEISTIEHENAMPKYLPGMTLFDVLLNIIAISNSGSKVNSTRIAAGDSAISDLPGQKREHEWWLEGSAIRRAMKVEMETSMDERSSLAGNFSVYNPDETQSLDDFYNSSKSDPFPFNLNPKFDLHCMVMVCVAIVIDWYNF